MVKNNLGGNKAKAFARKNMVRRDVALRVAQEDGEIYAQAVKIMGGSIASAIDINGNPLRAHIRGKFRGRGKRDNFIEPGTWLLVGLHSWETDKSSSKTSTEIRNCDVLEVYSDSDKNRLKTSVTSINWSRFIENDNKSHGNECKDDELGIVFADEATQEYEELIANQATTASSTFVMADGEVINVDDI